MATTSARLGSPFDPEPRHHSEHLRTKSALPEPAQAASDSSYVGSDQIDEPKSTDQERAVGITAFVSVDVSGFSCTVKQRYTDFLVNEILPDGHVLHLTDVGESRKREKQQNYNASSSAETYDAASSGAAVAAGSSANEASNKRRSPDLDEAFGTDTLTPRKKQRTEDEEPVIAEPSYQDPDTTLSEPQETSTTPSKKERKDEIISGVPEADKNVLHVIFGDATTQQILNLYASVIANPDRKPRDQPTVKSEVIADKAKRTEAHVAIRRIFASKLETLTMQDQPGVMSIKAAPTKGPSGARGQTNGNASTGAIQKGKLGWEQLGGEYLHFTLYKENKDTMEVLYFLASKLKVPIKNFQFAGTKDRRGVTVQRVAIFRVHADLVAKLNRFARGWGLGGFEYKKHGLDLGELGGNEFLLTLRDCHFEDEEGLEHQERLAILEELMAQATASFKQNGFLNYYGLQRFGTFSTGTHVTGQKMLKGDLEGAVDSILAYSDVLLPENQDASSFKKVPQDDIDRADAIRMWRTTGQSHDAVAKMPRRFQAEAAIINHLSMKDRKTGKPFQVGDWQGALMQIQRNLRLMYVHAYQSFVWNVVASKRWELYGKQVVEGDLVIVGEKDSDPGAAKDEVDEDGEPIFHPAADDSAPVAEDAFIRARHLTKAEAESGKYDIFDVVLPQPGYDIIYPVNEVGKFYEGFMSSETGGGLDPHKMRRGWKEVSLSGSYRKMMARPGNDLAFEVKSYVHDDKQMVETDLERMQKEADGTAGADAKSDAAQNVAEDLDAERKLAVVLKMQLGSSQYATMALRELTKGGAFNYKPEYSTR